MILILKFPLQVLNFDKELRYEAAVNQWGKLQHFSHYEIVDSSLTADLVWKQLDSNLIKKEKFSSVNLFLVSQTHKFITYHYQDSIV